MSGAFLLYSEIFLCVVVTDAGNEGEERAFVLRIFARAHAFGEVVAENAPEIVVPDVGGKTSGVREHTDKVAEHAVLRKGGEVGAHAALGVVEPPCAPVLKSAPGFSLIAMNDGI